MRIAYLMLCHKIELLIDSLNDNNVDFYIHVDKKIEKNLNIYKSNIFYLNNEKRRNIVWGSFEMVQATINLIE